MVREIDYQGKKYYYCKYCKLVFADKTWAEKCEEWCKDNQSCNMGITKHSIKKTLEQIQ